MNLSSLKHMCTRQLRVGVQELGVMMGIVARFHGNAYEIFASHSLTGVPRDGDQFPIEDAVLCCLVAQLQCTVAREGVEHIGLGLHPLYKQIACEAYLGTPILVHGKVWGTINFTSLCRPPSPFSPHEILVAEGIAFVISEYLSHQDTSPNYKASP